MTAAGRERRRAPRVQADFPIQLTTETGTVRGTLRDLSTVGLCCRIPAALREMTLVRMRLELPGVQDAAEVEGVVVRTEKLRDKSPATYDVALYFSDVQPAARKAIETFVNRNVAATVAR
ncbi:MAG TPA: PilZ domain-containing protein [Planctomycetota bacterium]|nr:PilZ domain-containing protein [Planctomycetota bacterium]